MPTLVTKTVKSSGGDYSSLSGWEAGEQRDLVAANEIARAECYAFSDTTQVTVNGWTTDATRYIDVYVPPSQRHDGKWNTSAYRLEYTISDLTFVIIIDCYVDYMRFTGVQIKATSTDVSNQGRAFYHRNTGETHWDECIVRGVFSGTATPTGAFDLRTTTTKFRNCLIYDWVNGANSIVGVLAVFGTVYCYNMTVQNCQQGFWDFGGSAITCKNCIAQDCSDGFNNVSGGNNNCSDIASDAPGTSSQTGTVSFVNKAGDDFHLDSGDTVAKDHGADLSGDANYAFSVDIDNVTRSGTWDIGADEYVAAGAGGVIGHLTSPRQAVNRASTY